jgi:hypothetical protein
MTDSNENCFYHCCFDCGDKNTCTHPKKCADLIEGRRKCRFALENSDGEPNYVDCGIFRRRDGIDQAIDIAIGQINGSLPECEDV